jgi:hypothetical protein
MAYPLSDAQKAVLLGSHRMTSKAVAMRGSELLGPLPVIGGVVTATLGTRGARDASFQTTRTAVNAYSLNPLTDRIVLSTGVPDAFDITLFTGRVDSIRADDTGLIDIQLLSAGAEAIRDDFIVPWAATSSHAATEIAAILQSVDPGWGVDISAASSVPLTGQQIWESDRGQALDQIASGANLIWLPDRFGSFIVFDSPYSIGPSLADESVIMFQDGQGGALVRVDSTTSRAGVYNAITVIMERTDNSEPVRFTAVDDVIGSPTEYGGPFGKQNKVVKNPTSEIPAFLAGRLLRQSLALRRSWSIEVPHVPILDPGDIFTLWHQNEVTAQVVESTQYGLGPGDGCAITSRELISIGSELE